MYNNEPEHQEYYENFDVSDSDRPVRLITQFRGDTIARYTGVLVECWHHKNYGRVKRAYLAEFDEQERAKLAKLYTKSYAWVMRSGHPDYISMKFETYNLLIRAANFFASH